jgi:hypothetical protein
MHHYFSADRLINKLDEDQLERGGYAGAVACAIFYWKEDESLVIALVGGWDEPLQPSNG